MKKPSKSNQLNAQDMPACKKRGVKPRFETGRVFVEQRVFDTFSLAVIDEFLADHVECEVGPCSDWENVHEICLRDQGPIFSVFRDDLDHEGYILTDPDRSWTMMMMRRDS